MNEVSEKEPERYYYRFEEIDEPRAEKAEIVEGFGDGEQSVFKPAETVPRKTGFFGRRFRSEQTWGQITLDLIFGVVLPVVCFVLDPFIFRPQPDGQAMLGSYTGFAYSLALATIVGTTISLVFSKKLGIMNAALSGLFAVSGVVSLIVGLAILPMSILGMFFLIGFLGFTPLISAFVMMRRSVVSFRETARLPDQTAVVSLFMLSVITSVVIPYLINNEFKISPLSHLLERHGFFWY